MPRDQPDIAVAQLLVKPRIREALQVIDGVVEVEVVVVAAVHEPPHVVQPRQPEAALEHVWVLEKRVHRVIRAE